MRTTHKYGQRHRSLMRLRALIAGHRNQWSAVEESAYETPDPTVLVLTVCVASLMDLLDDRLDELLEGTAA